MTPKPLFPWPTTALPAAWPACAGLHQAAEMIWQTVSPLWPDVGVEVVAEVDSTNSELLRRARAGRTETTLLVAQSQTAGRGRLGRSWETTRTAALTMSLGLSLAPRDWSGLSLVVGLVLAQRLGHGIAIKWPNDLWWQGRKLCGILIETAATPEALPPSHDPAAQAPRYVVIGMGVNLATPPADGLRTPPVGLGEILHTAAGETAGASLAAPAGAGAPDLDLAACAMARVVPELLSAVRRFERDGFTPFEADYAQLDLLRGQPVSLSDGRRGQCVGLAADGALLVQIDGALVPVSSGEVSVRPLSP
ncbi:biotin--[acetyl-CoA-carboxylase] ligase [Comamonas serinivorans]|uniref:biotin--[biotin carboxyl-carrier protein] ligase n=1 Tax=Comamonas serinivorans TaxID=1082851 RepID=A0A1Y0ESY8_9BURK|nr:biotin--[acetyl-CoA-carboxylase] ligase [Comamonas serinivorans]